MKRGDLLIALVISVLMIILGTSYYIYINSFGDELYVNIYIENDLYKSIELTPETDKIITVDNEYGVNVIHIHNNGFEVIYADCHNQYDVKQGFVNRPGYPVVCVPHKLKIIIEGKDISGLDGYSY